jgi:hypothetical protein
MGDSSPPVQNDKQSKILNPNPDKIGKSQTISNDQNPKD